MSMPYRKIAFYGIILLPMVVYGLLVVHYAVNIPYLDDYDVFLTYLNAPGAERLDLLFTQHNEHRVVFTRLAAEAMYGLLGYIDFRYLIYVGNAALFFIFLILIHLFKKTGVSAAGFLPVPFFLFNVLPWDNITWATAALQNYYVLLFALLALVFFARQGGTSFGAAILFGLAAVFTSGAGLLIFIVMALWSGQNLLEKQKVNGAQENNISRSKMFHLVRLMVVLNIITVVSYLYFNNYTKPPTHPGVFSALAKPMQSLAYLFIMLGSFLKFNIFTFNIPAATAGGLIIILFIYITYKKYYQKNPLVYYFLVFTLLNVLGLALARSGFKVKYGSDFASYVIFPRYIILSLMLLVFLYIAVMEMLKHSPAWSAKGFYIILAAAVVLNGVSFFAETPQLAKRRSEIIKGCNIWRACHEIGYYYPNQEQAKMIMDKALAKGYYRIPSEKSLE